MKIINPATAETITDIASDSKETLSEKFAQLKAGQVKWNQVSIDERVQTLLRFHDLLDAHKDDLAKTLTSEVGKPLQQSYNELNGARNRIKWLCENRRNL